MRKHRAGISPGVTAPQRSVSTLKKAAVIVSAIFAVGPALAGSFGMVADNESDMFRLFDSETGVIVTGSEYVLLSSVPSLKIPQVQEYL